MRKTIFLCDTPFQLMNIINMRLSEKKSAQEYADLVIVNSFKNSERRYRRVCESGLFDHVFLAKPERWTNLPQTLSRKVKIMMGYVFPGRYVQRQIQSFAPCDRKNYYDRVVFSVFTHMFSAVLKRNARAELCLIEDGTGSYHAANMLAGSGKAYKLVCQLFRFGPFMKRAEWLLVNNASFCTSTVSRKIGPLPPIGEEFLRYACGIFEIQPLREESRIVYLSQPGDGNELLERFIHATAKDLSIFGDALTIRLHPREKMNDDYAAYRVDDGQNMWELQLALQNERLKDTFLVGYYSTAQLTPKLLYNKEPYLVFTYRLYDGTTEEGKNGLDAQIEYVRSLYADPTKIFVPQNVEKMIQFIAERLR